MICANCKNELREGATFCGFCGTKVEQAGIPAVESPAQAAPAPVAEPVYTTPAQAAPAPAAEPVYTAPAQAAPAPAAEPVYTAPAADTYNAQTAQPVQGESAAPAPAADGTAAAKKSFDFNALLKNKTFVIAACCVLAAILVLILGIVCVSLTSGNEYKISGNDISRFYADGETYIFQNGKPVDKTIDGKVDYSYISKDRKSAAILSQDNTLYYLKGGKLTEVTEDCRNFAFSKNGSVIAYISEGELFLWQGGKSKSICEIESSYSSLILSPKGDVVVYTDTVDDKTKLYAYKGGKEIELGKNVSPLLVADGGSVLYTVDYEKGKIGYIKNLKGDIETLGRYEEFCEVSDDYKEIMYYDGSKTLYFNPSLKDTIEVGKGSVSILVPRNATSDGNFKNFVALADGKIKRFIRKGKEYDNFTIASNYDSIKLSADGKKLLYTNNGKLKIVSTTKEGAEDVTIEKDIYSFRASTDLKHIYFIDEDGNLMYSNGKKSKKIESDLGNSSDYMVNADGVCVFIDDNDALQCSTKGGAKKKVSGMGECENLSMGYSYFSVRNDDVLYLSHNGTKFEKTSVEY